MKLAIIGATGYVGRETLRQALSSNDVESILTIGRRPAEVPEGFSATKIHQNIVLQDFTKYPDNVKTELANVDACIWTIAITPPKSKKMEFDEVKHITCEYPVVGLRALVESRSRAEPVRFMYYSGHGAERDQSKVPPWEPQYCLMRGQIENTLSEITSKTDRAQLCILRPGQVYDAGVVKQPMRVGEVILPNINVDILVAAVMKQCKLGIERKTLTNDELAEIGKACQSRTRL